MIRLAVRCRPELAEAALAELLALAPNGVEEELGEGWVELAIYGPRGELPDLGALEATLGEGLVGVSSTEIPDDWADRWRDFHRPVTIAAGRLTVRPSWEPPAPPAGTVPEAVPSTDPAGADARAEGKCLSRRRRQGIAAEAEHPAGLIPEHPAGIDVVVDPGQAFGTGAHATTRLCLELLVELADSETARGRAVDLGTGSGVLAIVAARLGWAPVVALDNEPASVAAAAGNAAVNGVGIEVRRADLRAEPIPPGELALANLTAPLLLAVAPRIGSRARTVICSGLLAGEAGSVSEAFAAAGFELVERRTEGDWAALRLAARAASPPHAAGR